MLVGTLLICFYALRLGETFGRLGAVWGPILEAKWNQIEAFHPGTLLLESFFLMLHPRIGLRTSEKSLDSI